MIYRERFLNEFMLRKYNCLNEMSFIFLINSDKNPINHNSCTDFLLCYFSLLKRKVANKFKAVAHGISRAVLAKAKGALAGFAGAVTAGVGEYAKGLEAFQKIMVQSGASGISSEIMGGSFKDGFKMGLVTSSARYLYKELSIKYNKTGEPHMMPKGKLDVGKQLSKEDLIKIKNGILKAPLSSDQSSFMQTVAKAPLMDAFGEGHDGFMDFYNRLAQGNSFAQNSIVHEFVNVGSMPIAYGVTALAYIQPYNYAIAINRSVKKDYR